MLTVAWEQSSFFDVAPQLEFDLGVSTVLTLTPSA